MGGRIAFMHEMESIAPLKPTQKPSGASKICAEEAGFTAIS
jgi:hypothetical protein